MSDRVVIVGAGHAGVQAAASLREEGFEGAIALIDPGSDLPYHKPPLSKAFLKSPDAEPQVLRGESFYPGQKIDLVLGRRLAALDPAGKRATLDDGTVLDFSHAILATGSRARTLTTPGADGEGILSLRSIEDARALRGRAAEADEVLIVGGGFIGLEVAATMASGGRAVTVIEAQDRLLGRVLSAPLAQHIADHLAAAGVRLLLRTGVDHFVLEGGSLRGAVLSDGTRLSATLALVGIGATPETGLFPGDPAGLQGGIAVDTRMRTTVPDVFAIGDVARFPSGGAMLRLESVQNAHDQARLAAQTIVGRGADYDAVPWFWSDIGDDKLQMAGLGSPQDELVIHGDRAGGRFSLFRYTGDRLVCVESVNRPADHMLARRMLAAGFSPPKHLVAEGGDLKAAFQAAHPAGAGRG